MATFSAIYDVFITSISWHIISLVAIFMRKNIDATIFFGNALTISVLIEILSVSFQTEVIILKIYDFLWLWSKKVHFYGHKI